jgi:hypothetical protein
LSFSPSPIHNTEAGTSARSGTLSALVGKTLKDYYVLRQLGQGAMAEVY